MFEPLYPLDIPIAHTNLIEASAGTGKTWNIAALFTRLIVLEHYRVDKILVVTFTKAATAELKNRLRARLDEALDALKNTPKAAQSDDLLRSKCTDDFLFQLLKQSLKKEEQARLELRLKAAISEFDNAAIYTIHGFCQRVLQDFAFLCQVPFQIQLDEQSAEHQQLVAAQDFWRMRVAPNPTWAMLAYRHHLTPKSQLAALRKLISRPYLAFRQPDIPTQSYHAVLAHLQDTWEKIYPKINEIETAFWDIHADLNGNSYRTDTFKKKFANLYDLPTVNPNPFDLKEILYNSSYQYLPFSSDCLTTKVKKNKVPNPEKVSLISQLNELTGIVDELIAIEEGILHQLSCDLTDYLRTQRFEFKKHSPQRVFDDLLLDVYAALLENPEHAQALANELAHNWQVALIDEFQDTDPLQYAIFRTAFAQTNTPLFLVGDPKQAIYSFRGADIFAYLQAVQDSERHYTLDVNHRSHRKLMNSISAFFARNEPFRLPEIGYNAIKAQRDTPNLSPTGHAVQIRWLPNDDDLNTDGLLKQSARICANQIVDLLSQSVSGSLKLKVKDKINPSLFQHRPLAANDIAVLVRTRKEGVLMQHELKRHGVQSVLLSRDSIFAEPEAQAVAALLEFAIQPQKTGLLRFVLASVLFGYDAAALLELNAHEKHLLAWIDSANELLECWQQHGIYAALQAFWQRHGVETRLLTQQNERTLTNLHQIMELLAQEDEMSHTPSSLHQWLNREIQAASNRQMSHDHHILRLESDENLVKIVTMHAAKGLQYPIVFCPFVWKASSANNRDEWYISHQSGTAEIISKAQYKQSDADKQSIQAEQLSEDLRLLYVAMTRAEERLYLYVSHFQNKNSKSDHKPKTENNDKFQNALAYLLDANDNISKQETAYLQHWQQFIAQQNTSETDFEFIIHHDDTFSGSLKTDLTHTQPIFRAIEWTPRRFQFIQHTSFTSLSRQTERAATELLPALDADEQTFVVPPTTLPDGDSIHAFPHGAAAGVCLHAILERLQFNQPADQQTQLIDEKLTQHRFDTDIWRDAVIQMCDFARETPLLPRVNLASLHPNQMLSEMTFLMHTEDFRLPEIKTWFAQSNLPPDIKAASQHLQFRDVRGYISGAIDLLAQTAQRHTLIVDYKSNALGDDAAAYTPAALNAAMAEHHYYLQAFIYAIATARYLQSRHALPDTIAVRYLFLRGLDGISDNGVWAWDIHTNDLAPWLT